MKLQMRGIRGWHWLVAAALMALPGTFLFLPLFSWFVARRGATATGR